MSTDNRQQEKIKEVLEKLSLSKREIEVFLLLLNFQKVTASDISKVAQNIPRTSVYDILQSLQSRGLVSTVTEENKIYYNVENIEHIVDVLEHQKKEIEDKQNLLRSVTDLFQQIKIGSAHHPQMRFFEGKQGILAIHRELQNARKETRTIVDIASVSKTFPRIFQEDNLKDFQAFSVPKKDLMIKTPEAERYLKVAPISELHKVKWLPKDMNFQTDTLIWEGHVAIIDYSNPVSGIIIDNPIISETFVAWFEMMWNTV